MTNYRLACVICLGLVWLQAPNAGAQSATTGAIAGVVKDTTGSVLPGVTVEVMSPALIEKSRTAITDGDGQYRVVDLRPGTYAVMFTLSGFSILKRENIELTTGFTAPVNAELQVGSLEETVTVTGEGPLVDIQNVHTQNVLSRETLDAVPTNRNYQAFAALTLGAVSSISDVGGNKGDTATQIRIHGSQGTDGKLTIDGMNFSHIDQTAGGAGTRIYLVNQMAMQEVTLA